MPIQIREVREDELDVVLALNNAAGPSILPLGACLMVWIKPGSMKASVFPDPVLAMEIMSLPDMAMGQLNIFPSLLFF